MSKKTMKRSLVLGALMAFVITGSAMAADYDGNGTYKGQTVESSTNHTYGAFSKNGTVTVNGATFEANKTVQNGSYVSYGGAMFVVGNLEIDNSKFIGNSVYGVTSNAVHGGAVAQQDGELKISGSTFDVNKVLNPTNKDGKSHDSYGAAIYSGGSGDVYIENSVFENQDGGRAIYIKAEKGTKTATFKDNQFLNNNRGSVQAENENTILNFEGKNEFKDNVDPTGVIAETLFNKGTTNFKTGSETIFSGNQLDIKNKGTINIEDDAVVILGTGMTGNGTVNIAGTLNGRVSEDNSIVLNEGGTWNVAGDSVVNGIVVNGDAVIAGDGDSALTLDRTITAKSEYAITHNGGDLTIKNLTLENIEKEYSNDDNVRNEVVYGSVLYSANGGKITIEDSTFQNNTNHGNEKNYAVVHVTTDMDITNSHFINNSAPYMGGALKLHQNGNKDVEYNITGTEFRGNKAASGGAILTNPGVVLNLKGGNTFINNIATGNEGGGAINVQSNSTDHVEINFDGVNNFEGNMTAGSGGAIYVFDSSKLNFNGTSTFTGNKAGVTFKDDGTVSGGYANDIHNNGIININKEAVVTLDGGITGTGTTNINGGTLGLAGGVTNIAKLGGEEGVIHFSSADAKLAVETNENETLKFTATSAVNEAVAGDANKLISEVDWAADTTIVMEEGDVVGKVTAVLGEGKDGKLAVKKQTEATNTVNQAIGEAAVAFRSHWRAHMSDMNKRMGELRMANGEAGVWTRMVRGESEYEGAKAQYNQYQLGYDEKLSVDKRWTVGAAVTFAEGNGNFAQGTNEDDSTAFAIYGSKLNNDGTFVDLIARYAHLESDLTIGGKEADYSTNGYSVSAEFGKRIQQGNGMWIEPQVELTYGSVDGAEFKVGNKAVQVGDMDSLIGRVGFRIGKDIEAGNVYARASYLYDFDGETENTFTASGLTRTIEEDLGGGWWEVGVGANINLSKATYIYADVEKTFGGEIDTNWQWNLGVRYSF